VVRYYRSLDLDDRMDVLGVAGFYLHETVHKIDLLTTPFGASFLGRTCMETIGVQNDAREMLKIVRSSTEGLPLRDVPRVTDQKRVRSGAAALQARILWASALHGGRHDLTPGWGGNSRPFVVLNRPLETVTVHDLMASVRVTNSGAYLRPQTILESRAMAITALNLLHRLGADDAAGDEIAAYLRAFYDPPEAFPDYRFLLDLFAQLWDASDIAAGIEANGARWLQHVLWTIITVGWYALQAPPLTTDNDSEAGASPIIRLLVALVRYGDAISGGTTYRNSVAFLRSLDEDDRALAMGIHPIDDVLAASLEYLEGVRHNNAVAGYHPALTAHFEYALGIAASQLDRRRASGYASLLGMPYRGDLIAGFEDPSRDSTLLVDEYDAPDEVKRWFALRETLLFRRARPPGFWREIDAYVGMGHIMVVCECRRIADAEVPRHATDWTVKCACGRVHDLDPQDASVIDFGDE
jgi:hypothetical protein